MTQYILLTILMVMTNYTLAATLIEITNNNKLAKIYIDGAQSRIESGTDGYMIIDNQEQTLFVVIPGQRRIMDMSQTLRAPASSGGGNPVKTVFKKNGSGPRIAGYQTTRYSYSANGHQCGTILASKQALKDTGLGSAFKTMERMASRADAMMMAFNKNTDPCERAGTQFSSHAEIIGVPMRITSSSGQLISEVTRIEKNAKLPSNAFTVPSGYQVQNTGQLMQNAEKIMQQIQQSGQ